MRAELAMIHHWRASSGAFIVAIGISVCGTGAMARYDVDNLPAADRLAAASLELVISAWMFESVCGLASAEADYALAMRYVQSSDFKRRDQRLSKIIGTVTRPAAKATTDHSACVSERAVIEDGANHGRTLLNYFMTHSIEENQELDRRGAGN
jgi:hypothetical protein